MTDRGVGVADQPSGVAVADIRVRERAVSGVTYAEQYVIPERWRIPSFIGMAATFRSVGRAATAQNYFSIENAAGSAVLVCVRSVEIHTDFTVALAVVDGLLSLSRPAALPTNGTTLAKASVGTGEDTAQSSSGSVVIRGDASADGTNSASALTATPGSLAWRHFVGRVHTAVGQVLDTPKEMIPYAIRDNGVILRANESLLVSGAFVNATDNPATNHYTTSVCWEEYTLP